MSFVEWSHRREIKIERKKYPIYNLDEYHNLESIYADTYKEQNNIPKYISFISVWPEALTNLKISSLKLDDARQKFIVMSVLSV